jgi:toxin-antitoxin system PIN domain toxin
LGATGDLLDVNVWLAFAVDRHPHHSVALGAWQDLNRPSFCRLTQLSFLRLLCNTHVMGDERFDPENAWAEYEKLETGGSVYYAEEPPTIADALSGFARGGKTSRDFWTDAYLAAFAKAAGMRLVSFDAGFSRFRNIDFLNLTTVGT